MCHRPRRGSEWAQGWQPTTTAEASPAGILERMHRIDFAGTDAKPRAAFVILYALDAPPRGWEDARIPTCLMLNRRDGQIGFVGGMAEAGESLEDAVRREAREEVGCTLPASLRPLVAHDIGTITTHAFTAQLRHAELLAIVEAAPRAADFGREVTGVFLPHLVDYGAPNRTCAGIGNLLRGGLAPSVREELVHFLLTTHLCEEEELADLCERCGLSLATLIR